MSNAIDERYIPLVEAALEAREARVMGREWVFRCPVHDDQHPSARYNAESHVWWCHCGAKGGIYDLAKKLGVSVPDTQERKVVATYDYRGADGRLLYQVVRFTPKGFAQRRPVGGDYEWNLDGVERVPYALPLVLAHPDAAVVVVEGEKDADAINGVADLDVLVATTNSGGAGGWIDSYSGHFASRTVIIVPDNDEAGFKHAREVRDSLRSAGVREARVLILDGMPPKGDVSDWLKQGHTPQELLAPRQRPGYKPVEQVVLSPDTDGRLVTPTGFRDVDSVLAGGGLQPGQLVIAAARPGVGKSSFSCGLAYNLARLGKRTYIFSLEMTEREVASIITGYGPWERETVFIDDRGSWDMDSLAKQARLAVDEEERLDLIVIDYLQLMGGQNDHRVNELSGITRGLKQLAKELELPILALCQLNRGIENRRGDGEKREYRLSDLRESGSIEQDADIVFFLDREELYNQEAPRGVATLNIAKHRAGPLATLPLGFDGPGRMFYDLSVGAPY